MTLFTVPTATFQSPLVHDISLSVQHEIKNGLVLNVGYVGKLEHHLIRACCKTIRLFISRGKSTIGNTNSRRMLLPAIYGKLPLHLRLFGCVYGRCRPP